MKASPQPRVSALLRVIAGASAVLWLLGLVVCGMGRVCNCAGHEGAYAAHASPVHEPDAVSAQEQGHTHATNCCHPADGKAPQGHCGKNGCGETCCCSIIQASITMPPAVVILKPISKPLLKLSLLSAAREHVFAAAKCHSVRPARARDWVFTPKVCLGPAFRSHAPPISV